MINVEDLLKPVSPENPAGEDMTYDVAMQELDKALQGKPETQFSSAEEPSWKEILESSTDLSKRTKNLRVSVILTLALLKTEGLTGFRDGMTLLQKSVEQYWDVIFPRLDPEDNNDPTERVNILAAMLTPSGTGSDDPMQFHRRLKQAPLCQSPRLGRIGYFDFAAPPSEVEGEKKLDANQVEAAFRDTPPEFLESVHQAIQESIAAAEAMDEFLTKTISNSRAPDWSPLIGVLKDLKKSIVPYLPQGVAEVEGEDGAPAAGGPGVAAVSIPGTINSRQDVMRALDRICEFYAKTEPSSPVPLLLKRAQRMAGMNFLEIINDLTPDSISQVNLVAGIKPESI
jgi:type VI secretion system protein ImpA